MKLSMFIANVSDIYRDMRKRYEKIFDEVSEIEEAERQLNRKAREFSTEGLSMRLEELRERKAELIEKLRGFDTEWKERTGEVRSRCEDAFNSRYGINPSALDTNAVTLMNSGLLSNDELLTMAEKYKSNPTMSRLLGNYIKERGKSENNPDYAAIGARIEQRSRQQPHLELLDGFIALSSRGIRTGADNGDISGSKILSDGYHENLYEENYAKYSKLGDGYDSEES